MFHLIANYKYDIPKLLFQVVFKQILNNRIESISSLLYTLDLLNFRKNTGRMCCCYLFIPNFRESFVYTVKWYLNETRYSSAFNNTTKIQSKILNSFCLIWPEVLSIFYKLNETTKEVSCTCYIFYTMDGCLFCLNIGTNSVGSFLGIQQLLLRLLKE